LAPDDVTNGVPGGVPDGVPGSDPGPAEWTLSGLVEAGLMDPGWAVALEPAEPGLPAIETFLDAEAAAGHLVLPAASKVFRAFQEPFGAVRVLIVGQDPYPTPGHAIGLSFAVDAAVRPLPRSLRNIYTELHADLGVPTPSHGDLSAWTRQGVMLLNRVLTVPAGDAGGHRNHGWEAVTAQAVRALAARPVPLVTVLWGKQAQSLRPLLGETAVIVSAHPSPLSARRGFVGSRPFSRVNVLLAAQGAASVDWTLG
jgi:uracil-DNA glycosylase